MSAIDSLLDFLSEQYKDVNGNIAAARAELSEYRERIAGLEQAAQMFIDADENDTSDWPTSLRPCASVFSDLMKVKPASVLTPRKCVAGRACYRKGWEAAQEAAAQAASGEWRLRQYDGNYQYMNLDCVADVVRALEPPADCGGACNPLEPDADAVSVIDAAMSRGYTEKSETPLDGYGREVLEAIKNDIQQRMK